MTNIERSFHTKGYLFGVAAVLMWSIHNVGTEIAVGQGFRPPDLVLLRFAGGMLVLLPLLFFRGAALPCWNHLFALTLLTGPVYSWIFMTGFHNAPLGHAVVIPPCVSIIVTNLLERFFSKRRLPTQRLVGITILVLGLVIVGSEVTAPKRDGASVLFGDLCFTVSGTMWAGYTFLMGRWHLSPVPTATGVATISTLTFAPVYLLSFDLPDVTLSMALQQAVYQGALGGALALTSFAAAVAVLGAGRASIFFAAVPATALMLAIPVLGKLPSTTQVIAILIVMVGIFVSIGPHRRRGRRLH